MKQNPNMRCPTCRNDIPKNTSECPYCGYKFSVSPVTTPVMQQSNDFLAYHDEMTCLGNLRGFNRMFSDVKANDIIAYFDANNLKSTNDTYGHEAGDKLILAISENLKKHFGEMAFRTGGDEFIVIIRDSNIFSVENIVSEIKDDLKKRKDVFEYSVAVGFSLIQSVKTKDQAKKEAESKMYADKTLYKDQKKNLNVEAPKSFFDSNIEYKPYVAVIPEEKPVSKPSNKLCVEDVIDSPVVEEVIDNPIVEDITTEDALTEESPIDMTNEPICEGSDESLSANDFFTQIDYSPTVKHTEKKKAVLEYNEIVARDEKGYTADGIYLPYYDDVPVDTNGMEGVSKHIPALKIIGFVAAYIAINSFLILIFT